MRACRSWRSFDLSLKSCAIVELLILKACPRILQCEEKIELPEKGRPEMKFE